MGYTIWPDGPAGDAIEAVYRERGRQEELKKARQIPLFLRRPTND